MVAMRRGPPRQGSEGSAGPLLQVSRQRRRVLRDEGRAGKPRPLGTARFGALQKKNSQEGVEFSTPFFAASHRRQCVTGLGRKPQTVGYRSIRCIAKKEQPKGSGFSTPFFLLSKWYLRGTFENGFDIALVQRLLQHSSAATTQRYIGIEPQKIEQAIQNHAQLI